MPGFADAFWSSDYAAGLGVLFGKLRQGVIENQQFLTVARSRADAEELYGARLADTIPAVDRFTGGFAKDDGATVRKAYEGIRSSTEEAARGHQRIASNIRELVINPFGRWCDAHESRIQNAQDDLQGRIKAHDKQAELSRKLRSHYFNKCRLVEDLEEENKLAFQDPHAESSPKRTTVVPEVKISETDDPDEEDLIEIGDDVYTSEQIKRILKHMLETIKLGEAKVPILGTYQNVSTGADIVDYIQTHLKATTVSYAERLGQDLVSNGFLRLVGNVGNSFANSSKMNYQWRPRAFQVGGVPQRKKAPVRASSLRSDDDGVDSPMIGSVGDYLANWNPLNNPRPNETVNEKLRREAQEADERYKAAIRKLDLLRCGLEESMMETLKHLEKCELDRLHAIKRVILDFAGAMSNVIPTLQSTVDRMMLYQETVQPLSDLRYLLENYRTGPFLPKVQVYENYYNSADEQTFGVDIEARARADRKRVPIFVTTVLTYLDHHYPDLEGDEARRRIWLVDVPLAATHHLRHAVNNGGPVPPGLLERYDVSVIASVLKLYFLELPDSLVSSHVYEIIKTIYHARPGDSDESARTSVIQNTLGQLRLANIATLDAITTHFTRLIDLTSADDAYVSALATNLAPCILRPRTESSLTTHDRYSYRLLRDLLAHKDAIFGELKRASTQMQLGSGPGRPRGISTNERDRRANMEARTHAILNRTRAGSPQPHPGRAHRRERSVGGASTRFPIQASPIGSADRKGQRQSLEVPGSDTVSPDIEPDPVGKVNGSSVRDTLEHSHGGLDGHSEERAQADPGLDKRHSFGRAGGASAGRVRRRTPPENHPTLQNPGGAMRPEILNGHAVVEEKAKEMELRQRPVGVTLVDNPVDE